MVRRFSTPFPRNFKLVAWACAAVLLAALSGCDSGPKIVPAEGQVLLDGEPLKFGSVMFQAESGGQPARAAIQPDGTFVLGTNSTSDGATVGVNRVRVTCYNSQDPSAVVDPNIERPLGKLLIHRRYTDFDTSGIKVEVLPKNNEPFVLNLTSKEAPASQ